MWFPTRTKHLPFTQKSTIRLIIRKTFNRFSLEPNFWSSMYFLAKRNSIRTIFLLLLHQNYRRKTRIPRAALTKKNWLNTWTMSGVIIGARFKIVSLERKMTRTPIQFIPQICHHVTPGSSVRPKSNWKTTYSRTRTTWKTNWQISGSGLIETFFNQSSSNGWKDWSGSSSMREIIISIRTD
jgi:hypothetical protein